MENSGLSWKLIALNQKLYISEHLDSSTDLSTLSLDSGDISVKILAAQNVKDANQSSLVLKITHDDRAVLLTGDATGKTVEGLSAADLKSDIFQAAHHGADSHNSNSEDLIRKVAPSYVVLSAGNHDSYQHPKFSIIKRILDNTDLADTGQFHKIRFHNPAHIPIAQISPMTPVISDLFKTYAYECSGYTWASTSLGIYGTNGYGQGEVSFFWDVSQAIVSTYNGKSHATLHQNITSTLSLVPSSDTTNLGAFCALDLSNLNLPDDKLTSVLSRISRTGDTSMHLESLNLQGNQLTTFSDAVLDHLDHFPLARLSLSQNLFPDPFKITLKTRFRDKLTGLSV